MNHSIISLLIFTLLSACAFAQTETYNTDDGSRAQTSDGTLGGDIYLIPFQDKLFNCHFSKEIMRSNDVTFHEMRNRMKASFMKQLSGELSDSLSVLSYIDLPEETMKYNEDVVASSIQLVYRELPSSEEEEKSRSTLKDRLRGKKKQEGDGTYIKDGQLVTERSGKKKFMDAEFEKGDLLYLLREEYGARFVLSVNQFDLVIPPQAGQLQIQHEKFEREVQAHYSIYTTSGQHISGGIAVVSFPPEQNDLEVITEKVFANLAQNLAQTFYRQAGG